MELLIRATFVFLYCSMASSLGVDRPMKFVVTVNEADPEKVVIECYLRSYLKQEANQSSIDYIRVPENVLKKAKSLTIHAFGLDTLDLNYFFNENLSKHTFTSVHITNGASLSRIIGPLQQNSHVASISLSNLSLGFIDSKIFQNFVNLTSISVRDSVAKEVVVDPLIGRLKSLKKLQLSGLRFGEVPFINCSFADLTLDLSGNLITSFNSSRFQLMFKRSLSVRLDLQDNPISCDNSWNPVLSALKSFNFLSIEMSNAVCAQPAHFKGQEVTSVDRMQLPPPKKPKFENTAETEFLVLKSHAIFPCGKLSKESLPEPIVEWNIGNESVLAVHHDVIFKTQEFSWAEIDTSGSLIVQFNANTSPTFQKLLEQSENVLVECRISNSFGSERFQLNPVPQREYEKHVDCVSAFGLKHMAAIAIAVLITVISIILLITFSLRRCFCSVKTKRELNRRRRHMNSVTEDPVMKYSMSETSRRSNRFSKLVEEQQKSNNSSPNNSDVFTPMEWDPYTTTDLHSTQAPRSPHFEALPAPPVRWSHGGSRLPSMSEEF